MHSQGVGPFGLVTERVEAKDVLSLCSEGSLIGGRGQSATCSDTDATSTTAASSSAGNKGAGESCKSAYSGPMST
jgi:hypothetical protein